MANQFEDLVVALNLALSMEIVDLHASYFLTRNLDDLNKAMLCGRIVLRTPPRSYRNFLLGRSLLRRFQHTREDVDLREAIHRLRGALQMFEDDNCHAHYQWCLEHLITAYLVRDGNVDGLREVKVPHEYIQSILPSLETLSPNVEELAEVFCYFSKKVEPVMCRPEAYANMDDLHGVIQLCRQALRFFSSDSDEKGAILTILGSCLTAKYKKGSDLEDINEAIKRCCASLELHSPNSLVFSERQVKAGVAYMQRFSRLRRPDDTENAVRLIRQAVEVVEAQHPEFVQNPYFMSYLHYLSSALEFRHQLTGNDDDLNDAIKVSSRVVDMRARRRDKELPIALQQLADRLMTRYTKHGRAEDLREVMLTAQRALNCRTPNNSQRLRTLLLLSRSEILQSCITLERRYLDRARVHISQAHGIHNMNPNPDPQKNEVDEQDMTNTMSAYLSVSLWSFEIVAIPEVPNQVRNSEERRDKDAVINMPPSGSIQTRQARRAMDAFIDMARQRASMPNHRPRIIGSDIMLCECLHQRWNSTRCIKDLDDAISIARDVIQRDKEFPLPLILSNHARLTLGMCLYNRFKCTGDSGYREEAYSLLVETMRDPGVRSYGQIMAGHRALDILVEKAREKAEWESACKLCQEIMDFLVLINDRSQSWSRKEFLLRLFDSKASTYTLVALEAGRSIVDVIDMLERCRGSILAHLIDKQVDLDELKKADLKKANAFKRLQDEISTVMVPAADAGSRVTQINRRIEAEREIRACVTEIRRLPGFQRFLLGPTETELKAAAARGPIVIVNVTALRSDAIIITKNGFDSLPLPELKLEKVQEYIKKRLTEFSLADMRCKNREYRKLQGWLWETCVQLIFDRLKRFGYGPAKFHVWWIGIGVANFLPFHAAGNYVGKNLETKTALSRAISSYASTLKVLIHSQKKLRDDAQQVASQAGKIEPRPQPRLTVITMPSTPGMNDLDGVEKEAHEIQEKMKGEFSFQKFVQPSAKETMDHMAQCDIVHFACHGESNLSDPSRSRLLLQTKAPSSTPKLDELTLRNVVEADITHGKLAFLSACNTAEINDRTLQDEALHLVSGFQVAGYMHAIGNLWKADDYVSVELAKGFYEQLTAAGDFGNGENVAKALNEAVLKLARQYPKNPLCWAQYVHFGI